MVTTSFRAFHCMFGRFERNTYFRGFSGSEVCFLCFKMSQVQYILCCSCFSRTRRSGVHLSCMSLSESEEKTVVAKATHTPLDMSLAN